MSTPTPSFRELDPTECIDILERHNVGRMAFALKDRVDIEPIHYIYDDGWLYGRTAPGTKMEVLTHHRWIAFEVDEIDALFDWRSVVVKGGFYLLRAEGSTHEREIYDHAIDVLRRLVPETMTDLDPLPSRAIVFRIHIDEIFGRAAATA